MPNQYKNKVIYGDSVLMDITDTTAEAGDVASGAVFYAKNGARTVGTFTQAQSDWVEDDTTDPSYILNKPPIIAGDGEGSTVENQIEPNQKADTFTFIINGEALATTFSYTYDGNLPSASNLKTYGLACYSTTKFRTITDIDTTNHTITLSSYINTLAITNEELTIYYYQHLATGKYSHAEGNYTYAAGNYSHAEGHCTKASGDYTHAEGWNTISSRSGSHAEGRETSATNVASHAEGVSTIASGSTSHAEGWNTIASSGYQHVQGKYNIEDANGVYADIVGNGTSSVRSNAYTLDWSGNGWFAGKVSAGTVDTPASVTNANDLTTKQYVDNSVASAQVQSDWNETDTTDSAYILNKPPVIAGEADSSIVSGKLDPTANTVYTLTITGDANSNVFTYTTEDTLPSSASLRMYGLAHYLKSTTDVYKTITKLDATNHLITLSGAIDTTSAITNGTLTIYYQQHRALGKYSQAEGQYTYTTGDGAHAEGGGTKALGQNSHAEGMASMAGGAYSHAEGNESLAKGVAAHSEGGSNIAAGRYSHAEGYGNVAASDYQHVHGKYNTEDSNMTYVDIVGNGTSSNHSNAYTLDWSGNGWFAGKVTVGADPAGSMDVATKQYVDSNATPTVIGSTNTDSSDYISPAWAILYITDAPRNLVMRHIDNAYGQLFFNSWNVALSAGIIVSNVILYNYGLLCATLIGNTASDAWIFTVYPIQDALTIDTEMSSTSTNPVQNKVIQGALDGKVNKVSGKGLSTNDYTTAEKNKLSGIEAGAQVNPTIDTVMSSSSTNPVTNSAITTAIANNKGKIFYGQVDSTSTATAFTAQIPGITAYEEGLVVILKNGVVTSASGFTININGLGALPAYTNLGAESRETTIFNVAYTMMFVYENRVSGGNWLCYRGSDANTNTIGYQLRTNSMSLPMKSITYRYRLLFTSADGAHFVPANNTTSTNATASRAVCQDKIDPFGPIYYYGTTASIAANSRPSATYLWEQYTVALGYSFNRTGAALTLSSWKPVYVKCAPQADGSAIMDATTPYVQDLPTTADGKIYIFLGVAYSATNIELVPYHPVYCYRNGGIQEWNGIQAEIDTINTRIDDCVTTEELDDALANLPSGGGSTAPTLLGNTPVKLTEDANIKLNASGSCTYTLESDTVADFDILHGTTVKATITFEDSVYKLKAGSDASAWYNTYIDIFVDGLTVGTAYTFVFDANGCTFNASQHITVGHYILYDNSGNTLVTRGTTDSNSLNSYAFTASTARVKLRWYPSINSYYSAGVSVATVNRIYINKAGTTEHTSIVNSSGSFTDTVELGSVSRGVTISSTPVAAVYKVASSGGGSSKPLEGKTIVVFGDSLIGMYRGETSATAYIKNVTGATVYNVGFGGCRMATHPTNGYAQFSMWALADAVASGVWTSQDQYASSGSDYFAEQLATLKSIDFNNVDYVVIHYGTNDFGGGVPLGFDSPSTDCTTFCGAARHSIETLLSAYPKLRIYISLPVYRYWESGGVITYAEAYQNSQNVILLEYVSALTTIATEYYLPIIDGYHELGINRLNASTFLSDGTHHNAIGRRRFGEFIGSKIISSM